MQKALRDGKQLYYFADLWKSVLNAKVDSQAQFKASLLQSNMDFDANPGFARLGTQLAAYNIVQSAENSSLSLFLGVADYNIMAQTFQISPGRKLTKITVKFDQSGLGDGVSYLILVKGELPHYTQVTDGDESINAYLLENRIFATTIYPPAGTTAEKTIPVNFTLPEGMYTLVLQANTGYYVRYRYQSTNAYAGGAMHRCQWTLGQPSSGVWYENIGDAYFKLELSGYKASGYFLTKTLDLGKAPAQTGFFQMSADVPNGTTLTTTLYGSATGAFSGEETTYSAISDGWVAPAGVRYWRVRLDLAANAARDQSPLIDMVEFYYPDDRVRFRQRGVKLNYVAEEILRDFEPLLVPGSFSPSQILPIERVSSVGTFPLELRDSTPDRIQRIVSGSPLKNFRAALYLGADVEGFAASDLLRTCIGIVESADVSPKYRGDSYGLPMVIKNPITDLKRKAPLPTQTALLNFETLSIDEDGSHAMDSMINIMRGSAGIPARYIDVSSFTQGKLSAGSGSPAPQAHVVRRANNIMNYSDGTAAPDTRIKSPEEIVKLLTPLCIIVDGYITVDEGSRIKYVHYDTSGAYEETWADEVMVRAGIDAIPIEEIAKINLGYADFLYNLTYCGCEWDGSGTSWGANFKKVYGNLNSTSADDWAPGQDIYVSIMEANMIEVSKWLGPEAGYQGETLAQAIAARMTARHSYPPVRIEGAVLPVSQYIRGLGSVVRIWSKEFAKFKRRGIALSETLRFMITKQIYDQGKNRVLFDLLEIT